ncbi:MAG: hypothetical protein KDD98_12710 [Sphingomonadaceae bacterium]|nr:hypothetical protein [Sphingomonadaceae bacterium]
MEELESMSVDDLDNLLGLKPKYDIPPAARRSLERVGILARAEGGLPARSLAKQPAPIVRAALKGTKGPILSRWGHIMLRNALASRLETPDGMQPIEFAALRVSLLNRMGEFAVARGVAQDVDATNWNNALTDAAITAYIGTADITGSCPVVRLRGGTREDAQWKMLQAICAAYSGEVARAGSDLNRGLRNEIAPEIDLLLAQRYAGAAGRGRRAVNIEWDNVADMNPFRYALSTALGVAVPAELIPANRYYWQVRSTSALIPVSERLQAAAPAARQGLLSSQAMVDLYSQAYVAEGMDGIVRRHSNRLRDAYITPDPAERLAAIRDVWATSGRPDYDRLVLTAYAAARMPASEDYIDDAAPLIASMLSAGLDQDALEWGAVARVGTEAWALLVLAQPERGAPVAAGDISRFFGNDDSEEARKSGFFLAGLAGLGRVSQADMVELADDLEIDLARETRWSQLIDKAAEVNNPALVAYLAGVGMQGNDWSQMTPRHLYHIVSALNRVGMQAEARMIAAEAVARG